MGKSLEEARQSIGEVVVQHLAGLRANGTEMPQSIHPVDYVRVQSDADAVDQHPD
jgi:predicted RNase H-like HicB family nuclease